jgi:hypothetical protein
MVVPLVARVVVEADDGDDALLGLLGANGECGS